MSIETSAGSIETSAGSIDTRAGRGTHKIPATLIPGDGIGPEIVEAVVQVLDALGAPFA